MSQPQAEIDAEVEQNIHRLSSLLKRTEVDSRAVVVMMCGVAGQLDSIHKPRQSQIKQALLGSGKSTYAKAIARLYPNFQRLSIDAILASRRGLCGIDFPESEYETNSTEADELFRHSAEQILANGGEQDLILDRAFYAKEDRDLYRDMIKRYSARDFLLYFQVPEDVLWNRIRARREAGVNADCALDINEELLKTYVEGFDVPNGEGEIVLGSDS